MIISDLLVERGVLICETIVEEIVSRDDIWALHDPGVELARNRFG